VLYVPGAEADANAGDRSYLVLANDGGLLRPVN
jgi:hypothetical protein